jgi:hypothetical protein
MATIRNHYGRWQVLIRRKFAKTISKSFAYKADAEKYARETEAKIDQGIMTTYDEAGRTTLRELLERYRLEITSKKKSSEVEDYKIKLLQRLDVAQHTLIKITPTKIAKLRHYKPKPGLQFFHPNLLSNKTHRMFFHQTYLPYWH